MGRPPNDMTGELVPSEVDGVPSLVPRGLGGGSNGPWLPDRNTAL
jgi:hypothetical protein